MSVQVCCEPHWATACWTVLGVCPWALPGNTREPVLPPPYCPFCPPTSSSKLHYNSLSVSLTTACTHCVILVCTGVTWIHQEKDSPPLWNPQSSFFWQRKWPTALREGWCLSSFFFPFYFSTTASTFPITVYGCTHTSSIVVIQISSSCIRLLW